MSEIITKIDGTVAKYNMLAPGDRVVVGVSGGADSMLLLHYLESVRDDMNLDIVVANVEHGIRGKASLEDTEFVVCYCKARNIEVRTLSINAPDEAKEQGIGIEEYSRKRRYEFFRSLSPGKIATAHNLSDSVETVLFRLSRGTSLKGVTGINPVRGNIIRPLIDCMGDEIRSYCDKMGISYRVDETNADTTYARNLIRSEIVPIFERLNPSFQATLMRFAGIAAEDDDCLNSIAEECYNSVVSDRGISIFAIADYHISIKKRIIIRYAAGFGIGLDEYHLSLITALLFHTGRSQIKGKYFAVSNKDYLRIVRFDDSPQPKFVICDEQVVSYEYFLTNCKLLKKNFDFYIDYDKIVGNMCVRSRCAGDSIEPVGRGCTKSLKKLFNECGIDVEKRSSVPVVCDDNGIIAVKGCCISNRVRIDSTTNAVLLFNTYMEEDD